MTNQPPFVHFIVAFFSHNSHGIQALDKEGPVPERDPLLALMRGPGRRGTPGPVRARLCCRHSWRRFTLTFHVLQFLSRTGGKVNLRDKWRGIVAISTASRMQALKFFGFFFPACTCLMSNTTHYLFTLALNPTLKSLKRAEFPRACLSETCRFDQSQFAVGSIAVWGLKRRGNAWINDPTLNDL